MRTGVLKDAINRYKYQDRKSWARVFGRVLLGFLTAHRETFASFNLLVASPTFVGAGGRSWDHVSLILQETETADEFDWFWLIDDLSHPAIIKSSATSSMMGKGWKERQEIAEGPLRTSLSVPDPSRTLGKRIIVFDDVFTCGSTLNEVARCLRTSGGAKEVCGVSLARQTWGGSD